MTTKIFTVQSRLQSRLQTRLQSRLQLQACPQAAGSAGGVRRTEVAVWAGLGWAGLAALFICKLVVSRVGRRAGQACTQRTASLNQVQNYETSMD